MLVDSLWDVLRAWPLQEACGVGWSLGLLYLIGLSKLFENTSMARCLKRSTYRFGCCACAWILVGSLWDVLSVWSLQEVGGVGWVLGLLCFIGMS